MKTEVTWSKQVGDFVASQAPEPKRKLRLAIRGLAHSQENVKPLVDDLEGYSRLAVGPYRVIFAETSRGGNRRLECIFCERRPVVYELFSRLLLDNLV